MIIIKSKYIPFKGYTAMTLWPLIIVRKDQSSHFTAAVERHERIHAAQQKELLILPFFVLYGLSYLWLRLVRRKNHRDAYFGIPFEREAYGNMFDKTYLENRRWMAWRSYVRGRP